MAFQMGYRTWVFVMAVAAMASSGVSLEHVVLQRDGRRVEIDGKVLTEAVDRSFLLLARDGVLWAVQPDELVRRTGDAEPFEPFGREELAKRMLAELPRGFDVRQTAHYVICFNTSPGYAQWCGSLFERLYMAFINYWSRRGFPLAEPDFPLVAVVFSDRASYLEYARPEVGEAAAATIGYYSLRTNRMAMYDLTGLESLGGTRRRGASSAQINRILARPDAMRTVATVVHEATHQIAFNCGLHRRYSDCPMWVSEGIAIYFETPDLTSTRGWRSIGAVNHARLARFRRYLASRPDDSLRALIADDARFRDPSKAQDAYAEAWALTYFLLESSRYRPRYLAYLQMLSAKEPGRTDDEATRLAEFQKALGEDLAQLDREFVRFVLTRRR